MYYCINYKYYSCCCFGCRGTTDWIWVDRSYLYQTQSYISIFLFYKSVLYKVANCLSSGSLFSNNGMICFSSFYSSKSKAAFLLVGWKIHSPAGIRWFMMWTKGNGALIVTKTSSPIWYRQFNGSFSMTLVRKSSMTSDMLHRAFRWSKCKLTPSFVGTVPSFQNRKSTLLDAFHSLNFKYLFPPRARLSGWMLPFGLLSARYLASVDSVR